MIRRVVFLGVTTLFAAGFYYVSRFYAFRLWDREGLFGIQPLRPEGGLLARWLRGTDLAPFELLVWVIGIFAILTILQKLFDALSPKDDDHD
jgi:hypothetical protein